ncbi:MAG: hypothetical protein JSR46_08540 [Verrucomicrobia bacterium]|nr:hypothetical protein [Verrucomicrobiota bacterium]
MTSISPLTAAVGNYLLHATTEPFSKRYDPITLPNFSTDSYAKQFVLSIVDELRKDPLLDKAMCVWHCAEQKKLGLPQAALIDLLATKLNVGTCYGEAMKILELVAGHDRKSVTDEWLYQRLSVADIVRYQILHYLSLVVREDVSMKRAITNRFPHQVANGTVSKEIPFTALHKDDLVGRLSDFLRFELRGEERDYLLLVCFRAVFEWAHAAVIYYSEPQKQFFWYDPYKDNGLYSTNNRSNFLKGVAEKICSKRCQNMKTFWFTAYQL